MLFQFSDVGPVDAPTTIRRGWHVTIAQQSLPYGDVGAKLRQPSADGYASTEGCDVELVARAAGIVHLCHAFLVPAAQLLDRAVTQSVLAEDPLPSFGIQAWEPDRRQWDE